MDFLKTYYTLLQGWGDILYKGEATARELPPKSVMSALFDAFFMERLTTRIIRVTITVKGGKDVASKRAG